MRHGVHKDDRANPPVHGRIVEHGAFGATGAQSDDYPKSA
jgi:hypothetical protein